MCVVRCVCGSHNAADTNWNNHNFTEISAAYSIHLFVNSWIHFFISQFYIFIHTLWPNVCCHFFVRSLVRSFFRLFCCVCVDKFMYVSQFVSVCFVVQSNVCHEQKSVYKYAYNTLLIWFYFSFYDPKIAIVYSWRLCISFALKFVTISIPVTFIARYPAMNYMAVRQPGWMNAK